VSVQPRLSVVAAAMAGLIGCSRREPSEVKMDHQHLSQEEMQSFTYGLLYRKKADAVIAHLQKCARCHEQQTLMAMAATFAEMKEITEHNQRGTWAEPFWGPPYPLAPVTSPPSFDALLASRQ
jgi:hypothetical protein